MRSPVKITLLSFGGILILFTGLILLGGGLSTPRDFSSPPTVVRVFDQSGAPIPGVEVSRIWCDSDRNTDGSDKAMTDRSGAASFTKVSAEVGPFTRAWRKTFSHLGMYVSGGGTWTSVFVLYHGRYDVKPQSGGLHPVGRSQQDLGGVWFEVSADSQSNTLVELTFPFHTTNIDYALSSKQK